MTFSSEGRELLKIRRMVRRGLMGKMVPVRGTTSPTFQPFLTARVSPTMQPAPSRRYSLTWASVMLERPNSSRKVWKMVVSSLAKFAKKLRGSW